MMPSSNQTDTGDSVIRATLQPFSAQDEAQWLGRLDKETGAPMNLRAAVATARRPAEKLKLIRKVYPDAKPYQDTFVYTNPQTGNPTTFDEEGFTARDAVEALPTVGEMGGALFGGVTGAAGGPAGAVAGAGLGGAVGRSAVEGGMRLATGTPDPRTLGQRGTDMGIAGASSVVGEGVGRAVAPAFRAVSTRLAPVTTAALQAGERLGVPLTAAMRTGRALWQSVEASLAANPITAGVMRNAGDEALGAAGQASTRITQQLSGGQVTGRATFGDALKEASGRVINRFNTTREAMDQAIGQIIPNDHMVPLPNVQTMVQELEAFVAKSPNALGPQAAPALAAARGLIEDAAANGGMVPFSALRNFRTTVGEASGFGGFGERTPGAKQHLQALYDGLKKDILNAGEMLDQQAIQSGLPSPGARQAIEAHDAFVRINRDQTNKVSLETFKKIIESGNIDNPTAWAQGMIRDPRKLIAMRNQIVKMAGPKEWDVIAANVFEDMGRVPGQGDVWNPATFATNWNKLGPTGRNAVFGGTRYAPAQQAIQDLADVASSMKNITKLTNASQTARSLLVPLMFGGAGSMLSGEGSRNKGFWAGATIGSYGAAKILTSPAALRVITSLAKGAAETPGAVGPAIAKLIAIGRTDKALGDAINEYLGAAHQAGLPMPNYQGIDSLNQSSSPSLQFTPR